MNPISALVILVVAAVVGVGLLNESQKTAWSAALTQANDVDRRARVAMEARPDQKDAILVAVRGLNQARMSAGKTWLANRDASPVLRAIDALERAIGASKVAPRSSVPPSGRSVTPPARSGCFDRNGPIPGCQ